ncbi:uncharacterized protein LOC128271124 [Anopheles cruzii]|uniref:uncharacterized protein LOC128271124 n=1 Tax=Anopheles cruzii TaxID=68878 RepID=UPI0022EC7BA0|nr:uncharacterized protein LOC128271124 [Anopheles cruzii]
MRSTVGLGAVLLLCVSLQCVAAEPKPDLGIKATISGASRITTLSSQLSANFDKIDNTNVPLTSGYSLLVNMKAALLNIGSRLASAGMTLASTISTLAANKTNDVNGAFAPVYTAIGALQTLLSSGYSAQFITLQAQGLFITKQFNDAFGSVAQGLTALSGALDRLKAGLIAARDAPGNTATAVSTANVNKYVKTVMISDVQDALSSISASLPLVQYIIDSVQGRLATSDAFVTDVTNEADTMLGEVDDDQQTFADATASIASDIGTAFNVTITPVYAAQLAAIADVQGALSSISSYQQDLQPVLGMLDTLLDADGISALQTDIANALGNFVTQVDESIAGTDAIATLFKSEGCGAIKATIDALVASGPYASFCFSKFSPRSFNQFALTFYDVSECKVIEVIRLGSLQTLMQVIIDMIVFDVEDLGEAIASCAPLSNGAACLTLIGSYYDELAITIDAKQSYMVDVLIQETNFSLQRLNACVTVAKYSMVISLAALVTDLTECTVSGPNVGP